METLCRVLTGIAVTSFPMAKDTGLLYLFANAADKAFIRRIMIGVDILLCVFACLKGGAGITVVVMAHVIFLYYYNMAKREFGGISGDTAGWFIVQSEKWMLVAYVLYCFLMRRLS